MIEYLCTLSKNGEGIRVAKDVDGAVTNYLYEYDKVVLEVDGLGNQKARNIYGTNLISRTVGNETYYYMYNGHADVVALVDTDGNVTATYYYDTFGNITEQTGNVDNNITYAGYQYDSETNTYYLMARHYDPVTARFLQEDTYRGQIDDPLSLNLYTYCHNEPIMYIDPSGHAYIITGKDLKSDWAGCEILWNYLYGDGKEKSYINDKNWTPYMKANKNLKTKVKDIVVNEALNIKQGESKNINISTTMEVENGEGIIGYNYLHGTNKDVGGFEIKGNIEKSKDGKVIFKLNYQWNDIIDPNFDYDSDKVKSKIAKVISLGKAKDYTIRIGWDDTSTFIPNGESTGWLFEEPKKVEKKQDKSVENSKVEKRNADNKRKKNN